MQVYRVTCAFSWRCVCVLGWEHRRVVLVFCLRVVDIFGQRRAKRTLVSAAIVEDSHHRRNERRRSLYK